MDRKTCPLSYRDVSVIAATLLLAWANPAKAQERVDTVEIHMDALTVDDGLPQGMSQAIVQDGSGYMWFGTKAGLARYDGYGYTVFRHDDRDSNSIGSDHVTALLVDQKGFLWVGLLPYGLDRYDPHTGRFTHARLAVGLEVDPMQEAAYLAEDALGRIWTIVEQTRVLLAHASVGEDLTLVDPSSVDPGLTSLGGPWMLRAGPDQDIWSVRTDSVQCIHVNANGSSAIQSWPTPALTVGEDSLRVPPSLIHDPANKRMLLVSQFRILYYERGSPGPVDSVVIRTDKLLGPRLLDSRGRLWGDDFSPAMLRVNTTDGRAETVTSDVMRDLQGQAGYQALYEDRSGNVWFGSNGYGIAKVGLGRDRFRRFNGSRIDGIHPADTEGRYLLRNSPFQPIYSTGPLRALAMRPPSSFLQKLMRTKQCAVDPVGRTWAAFRQDVYAPSRLFTMDERGLRLVPATTGYDIAQVLPGPSGTIWLVAAPRERAVEWFLRLDTRTGEVTGRYAPPVELLSGDYRAVASMSFDTDGTVWMGTTRGLLALDPESGSWKVHRSVPGDARSLPNDMVFSTCIAPVAGQQQLWVGTNGGGLARWDAGTGGFARYTSRNGLPNDVIYAILSDKRGQLWLGTNQGLCRFDPITGATVIYTKDDGLPSNEFNRYTYGKSSDGELWFEGMGGAFHFDPEDFYGTVPASPTVITGMKLVGKSVAVAGLGSSTGEGYELPAPIEYVRSITLPYSERMITFSFACMDHTAPLKNMFRYMLENFSKDWVEVGTVHEATFTNLDPGIYTFRVQGRNSAGVWDERGAVMQLIITPPWWGTWWFRIAALLAFAGVLYAFYRYRLAQAVRVVRVRERIARDLHDEIGSTLSSVSLFSSVAQKKAAGKAPEASELLGRITESTTQVLEAMNDIVWAVNADNDDMVSVIKRMHAFAVSVSEAHGCKLHLRADEELKSWRLEMTQRKNLYLIFKEAVNNAVKYSGCTNLRVDLLRDKSAIVLRVSDDGSGFDPQAGNGSLGGGNGLGNMRNRAAEIPGTLTITSAPGQGTAVELRFVPGAGKRSLEPMTSGGERPR